MKKVKIIIIFLVSILAIPASAQNYSNVNCDCAALLNICQDKPNNSYDIRSSDLYNRLKGRIIITPQRNGEAYYVSATEKRVYFLGNNYQALRIMQNLGSGANSNTLKRVSTGYGKLIGYDTDRDGLPDNLELAIGTDMNNFNTDGDRYSDKTEIDNNYDPINANGRKLLMSNNLKGRIFLQVDRNGEAWYMNPVDSKKYQLNTQDDMSNLIKKFGLGISNYNFSQLVK